MFPIIENSTSSVTAVYGAEVELRSLQAGCEAYGDVSAAMSAFRVLAARRPLRVRIKRRHRDSALARLPIEVLEQIEEWAVLEGIEYTDLRALAHEDKLTPDHSPSGILAEPCWSEDEDRWYFGEEDPNTDYTINKKHRYHSFFITFDLRTAKDGKHSTLINEDDHGNGSWSISDEGNGQEFDRGYVVRRAVEIDLNVSQSQLDLFKQAVRLLRLKQPAKPVPRFGIVGAPKRPKAPRVRKVKKSKAKQRREPDPDEDEDSDDWDDWAEPIELYKDNQDLAILAAVRTTPRLYMLHEAELSFYDWS